MTTNNSIHTPRIALGGPLTFAGSFGTTFTVTGTTSLTLPTSGTLVDSSVTTLSSLATIGTITSGTWNATVIGATYGGTGINNGSNTITLAGNLVTAGAFATTLTATGATNVTLPTTGTLVNDAVTTLSSLTSIGTIGTGIWQGTLVAGQYGGTGVNNSGKTITLGGNLTTSGAFPTTFTVTASTSVTLPTSGTLCTDVGSANIVTVGTIGTGTWQGTVVNPTYGGTGVNNGAKTITLGGNLVTSGAFNTTLTATATTSVTLPTTGTLLSSANNLSDVTASTARTNLGLAIGTNVQAWSAQLDSVAALATTGIVARTAANTVTARTITGTSNLITVTNGDGVSGNPTLTVGSNVSQLNVAETRAASIDFAVNQLKRAELINYSETSSAVTAASSTTLDVANGNVFDMAQAANITTFTFTTAIASTKSCAFTLVRTKDATATARTIAWPASVKWQGGTAPTITQTTGAVDIFEFFTLDGGTTWRGFAAALDSK